MFRSSLSEGIDPLVVFGSLSGAENSWLARTKRAMVVLVPLWKCRLDEFPGCFCILFADKL